MLSIVAFASQRWRPAELQEKLERTKEQLHDLSTSTEFVGLIESWIGVDLDYWGDVKNRVIWTTSKMMEIYENTDKIGELARLGVLKVSQHATASVAMGLPFADKVGRMVAGILYDTMCHFTSIGTSCGSGNQFNNIIDLKRDCYDDICTEYQNGNKKGRNGNNSKSKSHLRMKCRNQKRIDSTKEQRTTFETMVDKTSKEKCNNAVRAFTIQAMQQVLYQCFRKKNRLQ